MDDGREMCGFHLISVADGSTLGSNPGMNEAELRSSLNPAEAPPAAAHVTQRGSVGRQPPRLFVAVHDGAHPPASLKPQE